VLTFKGTNRSLQPPATMSHNPASTLGPGPGLCVDCEGLRLDDKECGGFTGSSDKATSPRLRFKKEMTGHFAPGVLKLLMSQRRTDVSQDFPALAASAAADCGFCNFLRAALLQANIQALERRGQVSLHLTYA
jgi:hypothetical protein